MHSLDEELVQRVLLLGWQDLGKIPALTPAEFLRLDQFMWWFQVSGHVTTVPGHCTRSWPPWTRGSTPPPGGTIRRDTRPTPRQSALTIWGQIVLGSWRVQYSGESNKLILLDLETYLFRDNKNQGNTGFAKKSLNVYPAANIKHEWMRPDSGSHWFSWVVRMTWKSSFVLRCPCPRPGQAASLVAGLANTSSWRNRPRCSVFSV